MSRSLVEAASVFTGRAGGVSTGRYATLNLGDHVGDDAGAVAVNRGRVAELVGATPEQLAVMKAAHGRQAAVADRGGIYPGVDILVTAGEDLALLALAADCATISLVDAEAGIAAAVHSGWRGVAADAAAAAVAAMAGLGANPAAICARIGPAICAGCYEVSAEVQAQVARSASDAAAVTRTGRPAVDLRAGITQQLRRSCVAQVSVDETCTFESPDHFSYRRDGVTGRHGLAVRIGAVR